MCLFPCLFIYLYNIFQEVVIFVNKLIKCVKLHKNIIEFLSKILLNEFD